MENMEIKRHCPYASNASQAVVQCTVQFLSIVPPSSSLKPKAEGLSTILTLSSFIIIYCFILRSRRIYYMEIKRYCPYGSNASQVVVQYNSMYLTSQLPTILLSSVSIYHYISYQYYDIAPQLCQTNAAGLSAVHTILSLIIIFYITIKKNILYGD